MVLGLDAPRRRDGDLRRHARTRRCPTPLRTVGAVLETAFHPARSGPQPPAGLLPGRRASRCPAPTRCSSRSAWPTPATAAPAATPSACASASRWPTALLGDPAVLVLDEPANGLDPEGIQWLRGFLRHLAHEQGRTVLVSSHLLSEVEQTVDRVVIVGAGRLVREGSMEQLRSGADGAGTVLVRSPEMRPARRGAARRRAPASRQDDGALTVTGATPAEIGHRAFAAGDRAARAAAAHQRPRGDLLPAHQRLRSSSPPRPPARPPPRRPPDDPPGALRVDQALHHPGRGSACCSAPASWSAASPRCSPASPGRTQNGQPGIPPVGDASSTRQLAFAVAANATVLLLILGIIGMTQEYRHRTATPTFLTEPRRGRVVVAKLLAYALVAVPFALVVARRQRAGRDGLRRRPRRRAVAERATTCRSSAASGLALVIYAVIGVGHRRPAAQPGRRHRRRRWSTCSSSSRSIRSIPATLQGAYKWLPGGALEAMTRDLPGAGPARAVAGRPAAARLRSARRRPRHAPGRPARRRLTADRRARPHRPIENGDRA